MGCHFSHRATLRAIRSIPKKNACMGCGLTCTHCNMRYVLRCTLFLRYSYSFKPNVRIIPKFTKATKKV